MIKRFLPTALLVAATLAWATLSHSCANTTTPPGGGPKDTIPPVIVKVSPPSGTTGFPLTGGKITIGYDEYTVIKTPADIFLSPPVKRRTSGAAKGRGLVFTIQDTLAENTTYTLDLAQAVADNNEGNLAPRFVYVFSTGERIDSLYMTGSVIDCQTLRPVKGVMVAAYSDLSDSACFNARPRAATKTDDWGFFVLRNIPDSTFRLYAFEDGDGDYKYNPDTDNIAFLDTLYRPVAMVADSIYELRSFDMKDTVKCQRRKADVTMRLFKESQSIQYLQHYGRLSDKAGFLKFSAAGVNITEMEFMGYKSDEVILQYNPARDSLNFWIQSRYRVGDTLLLRLDYMKTDSTGVLAPFHENLTMGMPSDTNLLAAIAKKEQDTVFLMKVTAKDDTFEYEGITIEMPDPVAEFHADSIRFIETNPRNQTTDALLKMERDTSDIRIFRLLPQDSIKVGYNYELVIPRGTFTDIYGLENQEANTKLSIPQNEELSSITLNLTGIDTRYIVELVDEKMTVVHRRFTLDEDRVIICKYLKAGKYALRITRDDNRNGFFDTGNLLEKRQPEMVIIYRFSDGLEVMTLPERTDVEQDINITELFTL